MPVDTLSNFFVEFREPLIYLAGFFMLTGLIASALEIVRGLKG